MESYTCHRTATPPSLDGRADSICWQKAARSARFVDMVSGDPGFFDTRSAAVWDNENLYVAFWIEEPFVEAHQTIRDSLVFLENDVEIFIDGGDCYYEFEINAANTIYEVFFIWKDKYTSSERFSAPEFSLSNALTFGGDYDRSGATFWKGTHPRGLRYAFLNYDMPGLRSEVFVDGTLNDRSAVSKGWRVEVAIPWQSLAPLAAGRSLPPRHGDEWRIFFGRFEKLMVAGKEVQPHPAWCLSAHGVYDTHQPERWTRVVFSDAVV
eukprot:TRINITY_DN14003_c0_g1_i1.p1 TRINITY_DN14003_c0_g1~~TRINITY_DN14003_c0_g1_i1.p1  ORF type:complete len:266 (+),score=29.77 TRINITY_DN14003_c0_g1_i1:119-916(+)